MSLAFVNALFGAAPLLLMTFDDNRSGLKNNPAIFIVTSEAKVVLHA
jgi:hypothetical protein